MESKKMPADWAIERAREIMGLSTHYIAGQTFSEGILAFASYIEAHEEPPVDRKLLVAREAAAQVFESDGDTICAKLFRDAQRDAARHIKACLKFHELWEQGFGK